MSTEQRLMDAVTANDRAAVRQLVADQPTLADVRDDNGVSALLTALYRGHREVAQVLRDARSDLDVFEAAALGETDVLARLLEARGDAVGAHSADGFTALHLAKPKEWTIRRCASATATLPGTAAGSESSGSGGASWTPRRDPTSTNHRAMRME